MPPKKLLFFCELSAGHFNVALSLAQTIQTLYKDKYEYYWLTDKEYQKVVSKRLKNQKFLIFSRDADKEEDEDENVKFCLNGGHTYLGCYEDAKKNHKRISKLILDLKPDLILIDALVTIATGINLGIPYVLILSAAPTFLGHHQLPPPRSGLPGEYTEENRKKWDHFIKEVYLHEKFVEFMRDINDWLKSENSAVNLDGKYVYYSSSPYLNVFNYPKELDYTTDEVKLPGKWLRIDSAVVDIPPPFTMPDKLAKLNDRKLIYFSLGSMASCYKPLMKRLLKLFSELQYNFIVSTGLIGETYELYDNQYGEKFINQLAVLQICDVYISHCGNNGLTEACHLGVPIVGIPLFADQIDNAVRLTEKGFGVKLDAFNSTKEDFEKAIEYCLREDVKAKMKKMSDRIKKDNNLNSVCESIINLID